MIILKQSKPVYNIELTEEEIRILARIINLSPALEMPNSWKNFARAFHQQIQVIMEEDAS